MALGMENLGRQVTITGGISGKSTSVVFVKNHPAIVQPILDGKTNLCTYMEYVKRFNAKVPAKISMNIRSFLVLEGYVTAEQMKLS